MSETDITRILEEEAALAEKERDVERSYVRGRPADSPSQVYSLRIPVERLEQLRQLADLRDEAPTAMMRRWVLERLDRELSRAVRREPAVRFDELFDGRSIREIEDLLDSIAGAREYVLRDHLTDTFREFHRQLYETLVTIAEAAGSSRRDAESAAR